MSISSSTQPSIRARVLPRFPAQVLAGNGMSITKNGGTYVFSLLPYNGNVPLAGLEPMPAATVVARAIGAGSPSAVPVAGGLGFTPAGSLELTNNQRIRGLPATIYQNGSPLTSGIKADIYVPFSGVITGITLLGDQTGSVVLDVWKAAYASYPPTVVNTITAAALPTISSGLKYQDQVLTGWTTALSAGDTLRLNLNSVSGFARLYVGFDVRTS